MQEIESALLELLASEGINITKAHMSDLELLRKAVSDALDGADSEHGIIKEDVGKVDKLLDDLEGLVDELSTSMRKVSLEP